MSRGTRRVVALMVGIATLAVEWWAGTTGQIPKWLMVYLLGASAFSVLVYASDKYAARSDGWRTREAHLHLLSLAGGWPGALIAQALFRHKSSKQPFKTVFWLTVFVNLALILVVLNPPSLTLVLEWLSRPQG